MAELKSLKIKRGTLKSKVTCFARYLNGLPRRPETNELNLTTKDRFTLETRIKIFEDIIDEFNNVQSEIESLTEDEQLEDQRQVRGEFEDAIYDVIGEAKSILAKDAQINVASVINGNGSTSASHRCPSEHSNPFNNRLKLPAIAMPSFDGTPSKWLEFCDLFKSLIHNNNEIIETEKFYYLRTSLTGEAAGVIQAIGTSADNYSIAWDTLYTRYNNNDIIIDNHVKALFTIQPVQKDSPSALRTLVDTTVKHLRCLSSLNEPTEFWDTLIIYIVASKLDHASCREWEISAKSLKRRPKFTDMTSFLQNRWEILDKLNRDKPIKEHQPSSFNKHKRTTVTHLTTNKKCFICCETFHPLYLCSKFINFAVDKRVTETKRLKLCLICFRDNHKTVDCKSKFICRTCGGRHNTLLHREKDSSRDIAHTIGHIDAPDTTKETTICKHVKTINNQVDVLLSTAVCEIKNKNGQFIPCRILLDNGSQSNYITTKFCRQLNLNPIKTQVQIIGINQTCSNVCSWVGSVIKSCNSSYVASINLFVIETITTDLPSIIIDKSLIPIPTDIQLADPEYHISRPIDILVGAELFWSLLIGNGTSLGKQMPFIHNTQLGWIIGGPISNNKPNERRVRTTCTGTLETLITRFWEIEHIGTCANETMWSSEQQEAEEHFVQNTRRDINGRFIVRMPFKEHLTLGNSRLNAERRLYQLEKRLRNDNNLRTSYNNFLREYEEMGHMKQIEEKDIDGQSQSYYLPHHAVLREGSITSKIRVVFDASSKSSNGLSLNDIQVVGPVIQSELFDILLRFRMHKFILSADISKMYRQILVEKEQQSLQRILWRYNEQEPIKCFELGTVTYGTASAPFLATRCLNELALEIKDKHPRECEIIKNDVYVDDLLTGSNTIAELIQSKVIITNVLKGAGFELRKFLSNSPDVIKDEVLLETPYLTLVAEENKTLGIVWNSLTDSLKYLSDSVNLRRVYTKRIILADIARLFDPLGLLGPLIVSAKMLIQTLWSLKSAWDEPVNEAIQMKWENILNDIPNLSKLKIPRCVMLAESTSTQLHGFADASERAYGACVYLRTINKSNKVCVQLLAAKSRVAPLKKMTLPRLELAAALLLAQLVERIKTSLKLQNIKTHLWSDSTITLCWIASPSARWKTFVANRVAQIQTLTSNEWKHVKSEDNPADIISRGSTVTQLINSQLWWSGPHWLSNLDENWNNGTQQHEIPDTLAEQKIVTLISAKSPTLSLFERYSSLRKLLLVTAHIYRFVNNAAPSTSSRGQGPITRNEIDTALHKLIKIAQLEMYANEIKLITSNNTTNLGKNLTSLCPFLDHNDGLLRVGGRLKNSDFDTDKKHPVLLDPKHPLTILLTRNEHTRLLHCGPQALLYSLREKYWITGGRNLTRQIVRNCIVCFKVKPKSFSQLMGELPKSRITPAPPFHETGTDFAGPFLIKDKKGRGCKLIKAYLCLFICLATKACHIEIVSDLTTDSFIDSMKRFVSRRGRPLNMYSDNATNYVGADLELARIYEDIKNTTENPSIVGSYLRNEGMAWHFIPPRSPHFGGLWESTIKQIKNHLKKVVGNVKLTYEEMSTVTTQIEATLNSRPLSPLNSDPNDFTPLTPAHFLIGRTLTALPDPDLTNVPENRLSRHQLTSQLVQHFWRRWKREYLQQLQQRKKWTKTSPCNIKIGHLVILKEDNAPPLLWKLARVVDTHSGKDNLTRVISVKLPSGSIMKRAVNNVCPLPTND